MKTRYIRATLVLLAAAMFCACSGKKSKAASYEFTDIRRGTLERTVSSSGTINPVATVKVLPRMSGKVEKVFVDYNDTVRKGDILAELNTDTLRLQRQQQYANVSKARANYELQLLNYRSQVALAERDLISQYELKTSKTSLDNQAADLSIAEANLKVIETEINQYAYITSPIDGIVLDRNINVGDTVVDSSSNNSTSIFTLAENLSEMQIEAAIGELDVASIHKGQQVRFALESLPNRKFSGVVETLRMVPVVTNNVVSYTVIINVENLDGSLLPGMTCAVDFIVEQSEDVLLVANAALRYQPTNLSAEQIAEMIFNASLANMNDEQRQAAIEAREQTKAQASEKNNQNQNAGGLSGLVSVPQTGRMGGGGARQAQARSVQNAGPGQGRGSSMPVFRTLWFINDDGKLDVMQVRIGISDGSSTAVFPAEDLEGRQVILREKI